MTPAEKMGLKVGDQARVTRGHSYGFSVGAEITLIKDDGTDRPRFSDGVLAQWVPKFGDRVVFVDPPEDMVGEFGVVIEIDQSDDTYSVAYNDGDTYYTRWRELSEIKPYEAA